MSPANVLDRYYLAITFLVTTGYQLLGFAIAWTFQFDKITDFTGGSNFFILALLTLCLGNTYNARNIVASVFVMVWATRLAGFLLFRVLKTGSDTRFDDIRSHFFKFLAFWVGQIIWVWTVSLPLIILNSPSVSAHSQPAFGTSKDITGIVLWSLGWAIESIADFQKFAHKSTKPPKDIPIQYGLWKYSRHPPYFGEILLWWGLWILTISPSTNNVGDLPQSTKSAQFGSVVGPLLTMIILIFGSGLPTAEKPTAKKFYEMSKDPEYPNAWTNYQEYLARTSILVPLPPSLYSRLPQFVKWGLGDWNIWKYEPEKDGQDV
ncbi:DUF1295-domain-containing protein [Abortiporus biennis]|nr:DUF1295-domain-containing protein [Abortiporus biennis]